MSATKEDILALPATFQRIGSEISQTHGHTVEDFVLARDELIKAENEGRIVSVWSAREIVAMSIVDEERNKNNAQMLNYYLDKVRNGELKNEASKGWELRLMVLEKLAARASAPAPDISIK